MTIQEALQELSKFVENNRQFFPNLTLVTPRPIDVKVFPDECAEIRPPQNGLYILFRNSNDQLIYVGITNHLERRIYQHLGTGLSWARGDSQCNFPNMTLASQRAWLHEATQDLLRRGDFRIQVVGVTPPQCSGLLEAFLVARAFVKEGHPVEINVEF